VTFRSRSDYPYFSAILLIFQKRIKISGLKFEPSDFDPNATNVLTALMRGLLAADNLNPY
jgi:hypothetical protein